MMHELQVKGIASQRSRILRPARQGQMMPAAEHAIGPIPAGLGPLGNQAVQRMLRSGAIQAKLVVNEPGDEYEREADRVAEQVMSMPEPAAPKHMQGSCPGCEEEVQRQPEEEKVQTKPIAEQITPLVQRQEAPEEEEEEPVQAKPDERAQRQEEPEEEVEKVQTKREYRESSQISSELEGHILSLIGRGQPLPESERGFFEPMFGYDLSRVRMHVNPQAAEIARALNAHAFTFGQNVVLGAGDCTLGTVAGRWLLAHELTHVMQQEAAKNNNSRSFGASAVQRKSTKSLLLPAISRSGLAALQVARSEYARIVVEDPPCSNRGPRVDLYTGISGKRRGHPWCADFVRWCFRQSGTDLSGTNSTARSLKQWGVSHRRYFRIADGHLPDAGDIFYLPPHSASPSHPCDVIPGHASSTGHVGLVRGMLGNAVLTVEGNVHVNAFNDGVNMKVRNISELEGFTRVP